MNQQPVYHIEFRMGEEMDEDRFIKLLKQALIEGNPKAFKRLQGVIDTIN